MNIGVVYYNRGTSCYIRLIVSIYSLRKQYDGNIAVLNEGQVPCWMIRILDALNTHVISIKASDTHVLVRKASLWREMPFEHAMFLDSDTLVRGPIDEFLEWIVQYKFVATWFSGWYTNSPIMSKRLEAWNRIAPAMVETAKKYQWAINSGVQGWSRTSDILSEYQNLTLKGYNAGCPKFVLDEIALQLLLPHHPHYLAHHIYNTSGVFGNIEQARILHYHGRKHCLLDNPRCDPWKDEYYELLSFFPSLRDYLYHTWEDRQLSIFVNNTQKRRDDITIVTAVDPAYAKTQPRV